MLSFDFPLALTLVALAALVPWMVRRVEPVASRWRRWSEGDLRAIEIALLTLALAGPVLTLPSSRVRPVIALDVSQSVAPASLAEAFERLETVDRSGTRWLAFAERASVASSLETLRSTPVADENREGLTRRGSDLEAAVATAAALVPPGQSGRVLLLTDGHQTAGDVRRTLLELVDRRIALFPVALPTAPVSRLVIAAVEPCVEPREGAPCPIAVTLRSPAPLEAELVVEGSDPTPPAPLFLEAGETRAVLETRPPSSGEVELRLAVRSLQGAELDATAVRFAATPRHRVLFLAGAPQRDRFLPAALEEAGFDVRRASADELPTSADGFGDADVLILSDLPAEAMSPSQQRAIERFVHERGGGLLFLSGESTFGEEAWTDSPLESAMPVRFSVKDEESDVALMIVLDKSYSMRGEKIELARTASLAALDVLEDRHRYGLIAFDWNPSLVVPMQLASERDRIRELVGRIEATAQTNFFPALEMAHARLREVPAKTRHVILLSDGKTYPDEYERLLAEMAEDEITVSTIAVGGEADRELLEQIAEWGRGRSYFIEDARRVVGVLVEETQTTVRDTVIEREIRPRAERPGRALGGIDLDALPPLLGRVAVTLRDRAEPWLVTDDEEPLLASWRYGLGRSVLFTSDVRNRWASAWVEWPEYGRFWAQVVRDLASGRLRPFELEITQERSRVGVVLRAFGPDGELRDGLLPRLVFADRDVPMPQEGPGAYRAEIELPDRAGIFPLEVRIDARTVASRHLHRPLAPELSTAGRPVALGMLREIAEATGGEILDSPEQILDRTSEAGTVSRRLWPWPVALALLLFLAELYLRRRPPRSSTAPDSAASR